MDDSDRWWKEKSLTAAEAHAKKQEWERECLGNLEVWQKKMIGSYFYQIGGPVAVKTYDCAYCSNPVSDVAGFVKLGMNRYAHTACHTSREINEKLTVQERVLTEGFQRREQELLTEVKALREAKTGQKVEIASTVGVEVKRVDKEQWERGVQEVAKLCTAHFGPTIPRFLQMSRFIIQKMDERGLILKFVEVEKEEPWTAEDEKRRKEFEKELAKLRPKEGK